MIKGDLSLFTFKIKSNSVSQAITETPCAMSKKYTRISKSHIVKRIVETKFHSAIFLENYSPIVSSFKNFHILEMFTSLRSTRELSKSAKRMQISHDALRVAVQPPLMSVSLISRQPMKLQISFGFARAMPTTNPRTGMLWERD